MDDPQCFREEMRKHHAVVSGGLALQFFDREVWQESDMDVFVRRGVGSRALGQYLVQKEGYCMEKETSEEVFRRYLRSVGKVSEESVSASKVCRADSGNLQVETYVKMDVGERRVVQIIAPERKHPVEAILTGFYGSAVMNIITWNRAYSLFPRTTFFRREMCVFRLVDSREEGQLAKYERRGWKECNLHPEGEIMDARRVGDSRTWVIRFGENEEEDNANAEVESWRFAVGERRIVLLKRLFLGIL